MAVPWEPDQAPQITRHLTPSKYSRWDPFPYIYTNLSHIHTQQQQLKSLRITNNKSLKASNYSPSLTSSNSIHFPSFYEPLRRFFHPVCQPSPITKEVSGILNPGRRNRRMRCTSVGRENRGLCRWARGTWTFVRITCHRKRFIHRSLCRKGGRHGGGICEKKQFQRTPRGTDIGKRVWERDTGIGKWIEQRILGERVYTSTCFPISFLSFSSSLSTSDRPFLYFDSTVALASSYALSILSPALSAASREDSLARRASISALRRALSVDPPEV